MRPLLVFALPAAIAIAVAVFWLLGRPNVSTENAYVKADIVQISATVPGRVAAVPVKEHGRVMKGDVLVQIEPEPYRLALLRAEAELDQARMLVETLRTSWSEAQMEMKEAESKATYADQLLARQRLLSQRGVAAGAKLEEAESNAIAARDRIGVQHEKIGRMLAALGGNAQIEADRHAMVREKQALRDRAALDLAKTAIVAPGNGVLVSIKVQPGEQIKAETPILALVTDARPWIEANFKETDLTHVKPGQRAEITLDAYPGTIWEAEVESVSPATGAEFAILPPQNATGNWVKIVQRLPVRLRLIRKPQEPALRAGMTAHVAIDTGRERRIVSLLGWRTANADANAPVAAGEK